MIAEVSRRRADALTRGKADSLLNQVAAKPIDEQRSLGLDEWTGGEHQTRDFVVNAHECLTGLEIVKEAEEYQFDYDDGAVAKIVGAIEAPEGLGYAAAYGRERALPGGVRKASVISPHELLVCAIGDPEALGKQMPALIAIVNRELRALADAGCPTVQLDAHLQRQYAGSPELRRLAFRPVGRDPPAARRRHRCCHVRSEVLHSVSRAECVQGVAAQHGVRGRHRR